MYICLRVSLSPSGWHWQNEEVMRSWKPPIAVNRQMPSYICHEVLKRVVHAYKNIDNVEKIELVMDGVGVKTSCQKPISCHLNP